MATSPSQSTYRLLSALNTDNAALIQAGPTSLVAITCVNAAAITYLKLYNKATAPASTDTPRYTIQIPASTTLILPINLGAMFGLGLGIRLTAAAADNDATAVAAGAITCLNIDYC